MQESLYQTADTGVSHQTADAGDSLSDSGCRRLSIRQRMQETLSDSGCRSLLIRQRMQETLYQTADAGDSLSDSGCRSLSIMTADAGDSLSDSGCRRLSIRQRMQSLSIRQRMQEYLHQTADAGDSLSDSRCRSLPSDSGCRRLSIRQRMQETLYQTADAGDTISDSGCRSLLHQTADPGVSLDNGCRRLYISGCRNLSIRQRMQESPAGVSLHQTADAERLLTRQLSCLVRSLSASDSGCRETLCIRQSDAGVSSSDSRCRRRSIRQYDAGDSPFRHPLSDAGDSLHQTARMLSDRESPASAV